MYQSPSRNNFLDILIEPTTITILASIALHALLGAGLPFFTQLGKTTKKAEPGIVKVLELSPSELQRIPQAPPIPTPQVLPPLTQPIPPASQSAPPPISPNSKSVPFSPIRVPLENVTPTPVPAQKTQQVIPQQQPKPPSFNSKVSIKQQPKPNQSSAAKPKPKPNQSSTEKNTNIQSTPTPVPTPAPTPSPKVLTVPLPSTSSIPTGDDGGDTPPTTPTSEPQAQSPSGSSSKTAVPANSTSASPSPSSAQSPATSTGNIATSDYGVYTEAVRGRTTNYITKYPTIKSYSLKQLLVKYPPDTPCPRAKQPPFMILMAGFDKVPQGQDGNILGDTTSQPLDNKKSYFGDRQILNSTDLLDKSVTAALAAATEAEKNRPEADKGLPVLYYYKVQFDPATCKN
jgi:hypothetical protein